MSRCGMIELVTMELTIPFDTLLVDEAASRTTDFKLSIKEAGYMVIRKWDFNKGSESTNL